MKLVFYMVFMHHGDFTFYADIVLMQEDSEVLFPQPSRSLDTYLRLIQMHQMWGLEWKAGHWYFGYSLSKYDALAACFLVFQYFHFWFRAGRVEVLENIK